MKWIIDQNIRKSIGYQYQLSCCWIFVSITRKHQSSVVCKTSKNCIHFFTYTRLKTYMSSHELMKRRHFRICLAKTDPSNSHRLTIWLATSQTFKRTFKPCFEASKAKSLLLIRLEGLYIVFFFKSGYTYIVILLVI